MNQGQVVPINEPLLALLRVCEQHLSSRREAEAITTFSNVVHLAMIWGSSDAVVRDIFATAFKLPGPHPELAFFGKRATPEELAHLYKLQWGYFEARKAITKASEDAKGFPPLFG